MKTRKLGTQGLEVSAIGFGCMGLNAVYGPAPDEAEALKVLRRARLNLCNPAGRARFNGV